MDKGEQGTAEVRHFACVSQIVRALWVKTSPVRCTIEHVTCVKKVHSFVRVLLMTGMICMIS